MKKLLLIAVIAFTFSSCAKKVNFDPIESDSPHINTITFGQGVESNTTLITVNLSVGVATVTKVSLNDKAGKTVDQVLNPTNGTYTFTDSLAMPLGVANKRTYSFLFAQSDGFSVTSINYDCFK